MKKFLIMAMAAIGVAGWAESLRFYRKWDDKRKDAFESEMKLRKYVSFIHHTRGGEWGSLLPSQQRTLDEADEDYIKIYGDNF